MQSWLIGDPVLTRDGRIAVAGPSGNSSSLYQVILFDLDNLPWQISDIPSAVDDFTISGDGRILYVLTGQDELLRINLENGEQQVVIPRSPLLGTLTYGKRLTGGSLAYLTGGRYTVAGLEVWIGNRKAALVKVTPDQVQFQVPFEQEQGAAFLRLATAQAPFESIDSVQVGGPQPQFLNCDEFGTVVRPTPSGRACATREDGLQQITPSSPARQGDLIHIYLLGLGDVTPSVPTGTPGPVSPAFVKAPMGCRSRTQDLNTTSVAILSATLAPGLFGIYQLDIRIPGNVNLYGYMGLDCTTTATFDSPRIAFIPVSGN